MKARWVILGAGALALALSGGGKKKKKPSAGAPACPLFVTVPKNFPHARMVSASSRPDRRRLNLWNAEERRLALRWAQREADRPLSLCIAAHEIADPTGGWSTFFDWPPDAITGPPGNSRISLTKNAYLISRAMTKWDSPSLVWGASADEGEIRVPLEWSKGRSNVLRGLIIETFAEDPAVDLRGLLRGPSQTVDYRVFLRALTYRLAGQMLPYADTQLVERIEAIHEGMVAAALAFNDDPVMRSRYWVAGRIMRLLYTESPQARYSFAFLMHHVKDYPGMAGVAPRVLDTTWAYVTERLTEPV